MTKNWKKITAENFFQYFLIKTCNLPNPRPPYIKYVQATEEAFSPTSSTSKHEISKFFIFFGSFLPSWIRIRIPNPDQDTDLLIQLNPDPDRVIISYGSSICCRSFLPSWIRIRIPNPDQETDLLT
jgi:hypothetical protein